MDSWDPLSIFFQHMLHNGTICWNNTILFMKINKQSHDLFNFEWTTIDNLTKLEIIQGYLYKIKDLWEFQRETIPDYTSILRGDPLIIRTLKYRNNQKVLTFNVGYYYNGPQHIENKYEEQIKSFLVVIEKKNEENKIINVSLSNFLWANIFDFQRKNIGINLTKTNITSCKKRKLN